MIINRSISEGTILDLLKIPEIIPVYKKDDAFLPSNYRPIPLLSIFDKLLERIICVRLKQFLEKYNILYKYQFEFIENHSTINQSLLCPCFDRCNMIDDGYLRIPQIYCHL